MNREHARKGWIVALSGTGINLALGILYTWSMFKGAIKQSIDGGGPDAFQWDPAALNDPYAVCCLVFAFAMILAGRCQDRFGPRVTAMLGGVLVGAGFVFISYTKAYFAWLLGFGVFAGMGFGFGYSAATPPALKWFPANKTGLIAGIVVSGFGLASVYIAPLSQFMLRVWGLQPSMRVFGVAFLVVVVGLSTMLVNPPEAKAGSSSKSAGSISVGDYGPLDMLKTGTFYRVWLAYFIGAGAGLMVIGSIAGMAKKSLGDLAFIAVAIMAIGNAGGRVVAGVISDRIGRKTTLITMLVLQAVMMLAGIVVVGSDASSATMLVLLATMIGFMYGTNLSLFPSIAKDNWGLANFGTNYGILFSAWGVGGFVMGRVSQMMQASSGGYATSLLTAAVMLFIGAAVTLTLKEPSRSQGRPGNLGGVPAAEPASAAGLLDKDAA